MEQSFANVWKSMQAESGAAAEQLRADLLPKNLAELKANLLRYGTDPLAMAAKLALDTSGYVFSPIPGAAKQLVGAPVQAATGSKTAGEVAGNAAAAAVGMIGGPAGEEGALARAAGEAESAVSGEGAAAQAAEASRALPKRTPFAPDFPPVVTHANWSNDLGSDLNRIRAKSGNAAAATSYVGRVFGSAARANQRLDEIKTIIGDRDPMIVAVHADDAGRNAIPQAYASVLGKMLNLDVSRGIVQTSSPGRTGMSALDRLASHSTFDGPVVPGRDYFLVDDQVTQGGTLADLKGYIEARGGRVIGATTLTQSKGSHILAPSPGTLDALRQKYPAYENELQARQRYGYDAFTNSEGKQLLASGPDALRNRIPPGGPTARFGRSEPPLGDETVAVEPPGADGYAGGEEQGAEEGVEAPQSAAPQIVLGGRPLDAIQVRALSRAEQFPDGPYLVFDTRNKAGYEGVFPTEDAAKAFIASHPDAPHLDYGTPRDIEEMNPGGPEPPEQTLQRVREALAGAPANENRVFDIAGESPGAALNVTPEMRARAATYIAGGEASSPFELHLDQFAQDPVGAVSELAKVIPKDSVKPVDVTRMNAYSLNLSPEEVMAAIRPKMPSDEVFDAAAMAVRSAGEQFWNAARKAVAPDATDADMEEAVKIIWIDRAAPDASEIGKVRTAGDSPALQARVRKRVAECRPHARERASLAIVDYKTAADDGRAYEQQLQIYADAGRREGLDVRAAYIHDLHEGRRIAVDVSSGALEEAEADATCLIDRLNARVFEPNPGSACRRCDVNAGSLPDMNSVEALPAGGVCFR